MTINASQNSNNKPSVVILATGGTIAGKALRQGSVADYRSGEITGEELLAAVPQLGDIASIRCRQVANIGSEDMTQDVWLDLLRAAGEELAKSEVAGVVVTHGTDTMEETAVFLDLCLRRGKPVVLTGAMRPADAVSADGPANIMSAVRVAVCSGAVGRGVLVVMNDVIHRARRVRKTDTLALETFSSAGDTEGRLIDGVPQFYRDHATGEAEAMFTLDGVKELPRVEVVYGHAGQERGMVDAAVGLGTWGIVHAGVGMGNIHKAVRGVLAEAAAGGVVVVCSSRVGMGPVPVTEANRRDGFVSAGDLNPQKSRVVLQLALTQTTKAREVQRYFDLYR